MWFTSETTEGDINLTIDAVSQYIGYTYHSANGITPFDLHPGHAEGHVSEDACDRSVGNSR
jgi:hypothetical protein